MRPLRAASHPFAFHFPCSICYYSLWLSLLLLLAACFCYYLCFSAPPPLVLPLLLWLLRHSLCLLFALCSATTISLITEWSPFSATQSLFLLLFHLLLTAGSVYCYCAPSLLLLLHPNLCYYLLHFSCYSLHLCYYLLHLGYCLPSSDATHSISSAASCSICSYSLLLYSLLLFTSVVHFCYSRLASGTCSPSLLANISESWLCQFGLLATTDLRYSWMGQCKSCPLLFASRHVLIRTSWTQSWMMTILPWNFQAYQTFRLPPPTRALS